MRIYAMYMLALACLSKNRADIFTEHIELRGRESIKKEFLQHAILELEAAIKADNGQLIDIKQPAGTEQPTVVSELTRSYCVLPLVQRERLFTLINTLLNPTQQHKFKGYIADLKVERSNTPGSMETEAKERAPAAMTAGESAEPMEDDSADLD